MCTHSHQEWKLCECRHDASPVDTVVTSAQFSPGHLEEAQKQSMNVCEVLVLNQTSQVKYENNVERNSME